MIARLKTRGNLPVLMRDVADVKIGPAIKIGDGSANARPAVVVMVQKQPNANTLELTRRIEKTISELQRRWAAWPSSSSRWWTTPSLRGERLPPVEGGPPRAARGKTPTHRGHL